MVEKKQNSIDFRSRINSHAYNFLLNLLIFLLLHSGFLFKTHSFVPLNCIKLYKRSLSHSWSYQEQIKAFINLHWFLPGPLTGAFPPRVPCAGCAPPAAFPQPFRAAPCRKEPNFVTAISWFFTEKASAASQGWGRAAGAVLGVSPKLLVEAGGEILETHGMGTASRGGFPPWGSHGCFSVLRVTTATNPRLLPAGRAHGLKFWVDPRGAKSWTR